MNETPMLFPMAPSEFWKQMKMIIEEVVKEKLNQPPVSISSNFPNKALLKAVEICELFQVSKPTIYEWLKQGKLKSIKIEWRRYFLRQDIDELIKNSKSMPIQAGKIPS
jgi:excisionase family DNA binding protein